MQIIQISDCHLFADKEKSGYGGINPYSSLQLVLKAVSQHPLDLLLVTGDLSGDGTVESYQHFNTLFAQANLDCDLKILPGNHDSIESLRANVSQSSLWDSSPLSAYQKNWQFHLLNSHFEGAFGRVSTTDLVELEKHLRMNASEFHFIAVHHHPISCNGWMDKHEWVNRKEFTQIIESCSHVKVVVYGHIHNDIETQKNGVLYLACPSTCWQWARTDTFGVAAAAPGFRVIDLHENGEINHVVKRIN